MRGAAARPGKKSGDWEEGYLVELESLLTANEVAKLLRLSTQTLYKMVDEGTIPAVKVGSQWRFDRSSVSGWLSNQRSNDHPNQKGVSG